MRPLRSAPGIVLSAALAAIPVGGAQGLQVGDILVGDTSGIARVDPVTGVVSPYSSFVARGVAADPGRGVYAVGVDSVVALDPVTGAATPIASGGYLAAGLADIELGPAGSLYVTGASGVVRVDAATGSQTFLSDAASYMQAPYDLAIGQDGSIYALGVRLPGDVDPFLGRIVRIDPSTGATTFVGAAAVGSTPASPPEFAIGPDGRLYWGEVAASAIRAMDPAVGESDDVFTTLDFTTQNGLAIEVDGDVLVLGFLLPYPGAPGSGSWALGRTDRTTGTTTALTDPFPFAPQFMTVVVPEPPPLTLAAAALALLALARRSSRRRLASA